MLPAVTATIWVWITRMILRSTEDLSLTVFALTGDTIWRIQYRRGQLERL